MLPMTNNEVHALIYTALTMAVDGRIDLPQLANVAVDVDDTEVEVSIFVEGSEDEVVVVFQVYDLHVSDDPPLFVYEALLGALEGL